MKAMSVGGEGWSSVEAQSDPRLCDAKGPTGWSSRNVFSRSGPLHMELIEGPRDSVWGTSQLAIPHHVAYWSEDFSNDARTLVSEGWEIELTFIADDRPCEFGYFHKRGEARVELVDVRRRGGFVERMARPG